MLTQEKLKEVLDYNPETGLFTWKVNRPPRAKAGDKAGGDHGNGYIRISIAGKRHFAHRLAMLWMTGSTPAEVDHINQCRWDNRWINLRAADHSTNMANVSGKKGVRLHYGGWQARYGHATLGTFATKAEAVAARRAAEVAAAGIDPNGPRPEKINQTHSPKPKRRFTHQGKTLSEWARITGIPQPTLHWRIFTNGQSPEEALAKGTTK